MENRSLAPTFLYSTVNTSVYVLCRVVHCRNHLVAIFWAADTANSSMYTKKSEVVRQLRMVAMITMDITMGSLTTMYDHRNQLNTESGQTIDFTAAQKCPKVSPKRGYTR